MENTQKIPPGPDGKTALIVAFVTILVAVLGIVWLVKINNKPEFTMTDTTSASSTPQNQTQTENLKIETLKPGQGEKAKPGDTVTVNYTGTFTNGTKFDSSFDHGKPFSFTLGQGSVIKGWDQGIIGMQVGEKRKLTVPPSLGYGPNDYSGIPGNSTLIFEVDLLKIN